MREKKLLFLFMQQLVVVTYFSLTSLIFLLAFNKDHEGISLNLFGGGDDGYFYWEQAKNISHGQDAILTSIYPVIIGYLLKITGIENVYIIRLFNLLGFIILLILSYYTVSLIFKFNDIRLEKSYIYDAKNLLLICFLCYSSLLMYANLSIFRDIWIYSLYLLSVILSIKLIFQRNNKLLNIFLLLPVLWLLGEFRSYALLGFVLSISCYFFYKILIKRFNLVFIIFSIFVVYGVYYTIYIDFNVPIVNKSLRDILNYRWSGLTIYFGGSQMNIRLDESNYFIFLINYVHSYIGNLIGPLPWHIKGISTLIIFFIESIPMLLILYFLWKKRDILTIVQKYILVHFFVWIGLIAISNDNLGTATRLRAVGWILVLIVFVVTYINNKFNKKISNNMKNP